MTQFQITLNYGNGTKAFLYFNTIGVRPNIDLVERMAINKVNEDWKNTNFSLYFSKPKPARPTIIVCEYKDGKKIKNGINFKCKWR